MYPMFQTTQDLLFIILAFCILTVTVFLVWLLYYGIRIMRDISRVVKGVEDKVEKVGKIIDTAKEKIDHSAGHFILMVETIKELVKFFVQRRSQREQKKKESRK